MRPLATRLFLSFLGAFASVTLVFVLLARAEGASFTPSSWTMLAAYAAASAAAFAAVATATARGVSLPVAALNDQLDAVAPGESHRVAARSADPEMRELEEHVNALLARVDESVRELREYAAQVAHELRTPLTVMRLKIEQAAGSIEPQLAEDLQSELLRLTMLVEQALLAARAERGAVVPEMSVVDLRRVLEDVVEDFRLMAREQGREVTVEACAAPVTADAKLVRQTLYCLLTNAQRHGSGRVAVRLREMPSGYRLLIANAVSPGSGAGQGLGLGQRLVAALIGLHPNARLRWRRGARSYAVRLFFRSE